MRVGDALYASSKTQNYAKSNPRLLLAAAASLSSRVAPHAARLLRCRPSLSWAYLRTVEADMAKRRVWLAVCTSIALSLCHVHDAIAQAQSSQPPGASPPTPLPDDRAHISDGSSSSNQAAQN